MERFEKMSSEGKKEFIKLIEMMAEEGKEEGTGDADALALTAAEFVRVAVVPVGFKSYLLHEGEDFLINEELFKDFKPSSI